jgi:hypothetical protein
VKVNEENHVKEAGQDKKVVELIHYGTVDQYL